MLIQLSANKPEFLPINFRPGFNAIVAARDPDATDVDSRNARGKSSLLRIVNYMLGGSLHSSLSPLAADGWSFSLLLRMFQGEVVVTRSLSFGARLTIEAYGAAEEVVGPYSREGEISLEDWKAILGLGMFRLEPESDGRPSLSVRTLLSYVVRVDPPADPLKIIASQSAIKSREHVAFLLGLDWRVVQRLSSIGKSLDQLNTVAVVARDGLLSGIRPEEELLLERASLRNELEIWRSRVGDFRVLEDPSGLVARANELTAEIASRRDAALVEKRMADLYASSLADPDSNQPSQVRELFEAAGAVLAEGFKRRLEDVEAFHKTLLANRREFLSIELEAMRVRAERRNNELTLLSSQREAAMSALRAGGALEELAALQNEVAEIEARASVVEQQIAQAREIVTKRDELKLQKATERKNASAELASSRDKLDRISDRFSSKMRRLYDTDAVLSVAVDDDGYKFSVDVSGSASAGVNRMKLFCFDLTMLEEGAESGHHPDFLIHDSSVFDGVDPRQRATVLMFAQQTVETTGAQYICTINSNDIPDEVLTEDWFKDGVVREVLDTDVGGLMGVRF